MLAISSIKRKIGDTLLEAGVVTAALLEEAMEVMEREPEHQRRRLPTVLIKDFGANEQAVMRQVAAMYAFNEVGLGDTYKSPEQIERCRQVVNLLPEHFVSDLINARAVPWFSSGNKILIAAADPLERKLNELIEKLPFRQHEIAYLPSDKLKFVSGQVFELKNEFLELLEEYSSGVDYLDEEEEILTEEQIDAEINQSMLNSLVEGMLVEAVRKDVSDIHVIPVDKSHADIFFRIDGKLQLWIKQNNIRPEALCAVIKDKTQNVDRFERDMSQDGFIQRMVDGHQIRYRVSIIPMVGADFNRKFESVVIRILDDRKVITDLAKLGLQPFAKKVFEKAINKPSGIVIITGPTGSGKSTTLVAALYAVIDPSVNVLTVEEPVEYLIRGARQLKISDKMSFDLAMRGILRHDPDIVLVGEIRDLKTAEIAIKLANTGHLTFSTLHTNDAPSAVSRLYKMGIEPFLIATSVSLVVAQRLIRKLCEVCKKPAEKDGALFEMAKVVGFTQEEIEQTTFFEPVGCPRCNKGFKGRMAIYEALYFDKEIKKMIYESGNNVDEDMIRQTAIKNGMLTLRASGRLRISNGNTSVSEILAATIED
ncbi:MAG: Flp pilus assembly complex ATPase component TadA [Candidatus Cyclonatronum sp.]|uniref:GspE/PulE family protein n=1 Tax=Cyclonatronum sp. TaxID=3024185 RepID=UPI0025BA1846|nr:ATPase, T2SS/T4P/T4SS family [Cyclonatronum sp.]MCH8486774.1 Flp pilus assembly complex ATPase component TadA [Cyclonatronum sp.]